MTKYKFKKIAVFLLPAAIYFFLISGLVRAILEKGLPSAEAAAWMQAAGLEWLYRAAREPIRLGWRYLVTSPVAIYYLATKTRD